MTVLELKEKLWQGQQVQFKNVENCDITDVCTVIIPENTNKPIFVLTDLLVEKGCLLEVIKYDSCNVFKIGNTMNDRLEILIGYE